MTKTPEGCVSHVLRNSAGIQLRKHAASLSPSNLGKTHSSSGLLERSNSSLTNVQEAEKKTLAFLEKWIKPGEAPLCGNSVHQDRRFMVKEMQNLEKFLHYRIIDVSTLKELANRWYPEESDNTPPKKRTHLALDDIRESIEELQWYRDNIFKNS